MLLAQFPRQHAEVRQAKEASLAQVQEAREEGLQEESQLPEKGREARTAQHRGTFEEP
eukprot:SAG22_NODE_2480_length_2528_cov_39.510910_2_plen_58_part_00